LTGGPCIRCVNAWWSAQEKEITRKKASEAMESGATFWQTASASVRLPKPSLTAIGGEKKSAEKGEGKREGDSDGEKRQCASTQ